MLVEARCFMSLRLRAITSSEGLIGHMVALGQRLPGATVTPRLPSFPALFEQEASALFARLARRRARYRPARLHL